jgi:tetratricopeptide (TPR) repeat protein
MDVQKILEKSDKLFNEGKAAEAVPYLESCLGQAKEEGDWQCELTISNELMGYYRSLSKFDIAWQHAVTAVELVTKYGLDETLAGVTCFLNIANIYRAQGDISEAMDLYQRVEQIYKREGLTSDYRLGGLYNNMSVASLEAGNREDAIKYGEAAAEVLAEIPNTADERATVFSNMATVLLQSPKPDYERVEFYLDRSLHLFETECPNSAHICGALSTKAYVTYLKGDLEGALGEYEKAMAETKKYYGENVDYKRLIENYNEIRRRLGHVE